MQTSTPQTLCHRMPVLRRNDKQKTPDEMVKVLQQLLNKFGFSLKVDGFFGAKTEAAVKEYQERINDHDLKFPVDGIVGPKTWNALGACINHNVDIDGNLNLERLQIGGVKLSMSEVQVKKVLGQPQEIKNGYMAIAGKTRTLLYSGLTVELLEDVKPTGNFFVYEIEADSSRYATKDGVKVGDLVSKVTSVYGGTEFGETDSTTTLSYPVNSTSPAYFVFTIQNGKVKKITCGEFLG